MADWTDPPWPQLVAGKAWTDEKAAAAFENPIAMAEGAPDAPKIQGRALDVYVGGGVLPYRVSGAIGFSDLDRETWLMVFGSLGLASGTGITCDVSFSADNGATWGAWAVVASVGNAVIDPLISYATMINIKSHPSAPANANAVRFSYSGQDGVSAGAGTISVLSFGGLP